MTKRLNRVILTGGNGYLGSELVKQLLARDVEVFAISNCNVDRLVQLLPEHRIRAIAKDFPAVASFVEEIQPDAIIHLAAVHAEPPTFGQMVDMLNSGVLLGVALLHGAAACPSAPVFLQAGTYWQFEGDGYAPNTFYAATKQALHDMLEYYRRIRSIPSATLILYDIFGPEDTRPKLWSRILNADPGSVLPLSEGRQLVEVVHVADVARAFTHAATLLLNGISLEPFQAVRSGITITLRELLEQVQAQTGLDVQLDWGACPYWPGQIFEPWQGPMLWGWQPTVSAVRGLSEIIRGRQALENR